MTLLFILTLAGRSYSQRLDSVALAHENYFRYTYDNDFFSATDRYYTQGVRLELILQGFKYNPVRCLLIPLNHTTKKYYGLAFERDGFTPRSIRHDSIYFGERPYAGLSYLSSFIMSLDSVKNQKMTSCLDLGIIGPASLGAEEQMFIHKKLNNIQPLGWEYQIANDVVINYKVKYEKGLIQSKSFEVIGLVEGRAGTLYDDLSLGGTIRVGRLKNYFADLGTARFSRNRKLQFYFLLQGALKGVAYNATMQGGAFNHSSVHTLGSDEVNRLVLTYSGGVVFAYKRLSIEYTKAYITKEFYNGLNHGWGHCYITVCF
jgi:hypothetical protein